MKVDAETGSFTRRFAKRKTWKIDEGLLEAMLEATDHGQTIADLGAGIGRYVAAFRESGRPAFGYDGIPDVAKLSDGLVEQMDLSAAQFYFARQLRKIPAFDVAICIEVGEHIPKEREWQFLDNVSCVAEHLLIVSWGTPGQRGTAHVNCRMPEWVAGQCSRRGWIVEESKTQRARETAGRGWSHKLLVFERY